MLLVFDHVEYFQFLSYAIIFSLLYFFIFTMTLNYPKKIIIKKKRKKERKKETLVGWTSGPVGMDLQFLFGALIAQ